jgi:hypothetical protein
VASLFLRRIGSLTVMAFLTAGCVATGGSDQVGLVRPAETSVPKGTSDPRVRAAVTAYQKFTEAVVRAQQKTEPSPSPSVAEFGQFSFDPVEGEYQARLKLLHRAKAHFRGTPPQSHLRVTSIDPDASPWPTVTLSDCQTGHEQWQAVDVRTGKPAPGQEPMVPRPYGATITVVYHQQHWGVHTISLDSSRTCPD